MILSKNCRKQMLGLIMVLAVAGVPATAPADELLDIMPDNSLLCVRVNGLNPTLMKIDEFLAGASPVGISMFARMGLGSVFGNPMMPGVDQNGSFGAFVYARAPEPGVSATVPPVEGALLVPVTDYKTFLESNPNCSEADAQGLSSLTSAQQQLPDITIAQVGGYALLGVETARDPFIALRDALNAKGAPLSRVLKSDQQATATEAPIWIHFNMKRINETFGPMIQGQLMMVSQMMEQQMQAAPQAMPMNPANIMGAYGEIINRLLTETQNLTITVTPSARALAIRKTVVAVPDTDMAKALVGETNKQPNRLLGYLRDGAFMNVAFNPSHACMQPMNEWSMSLISSMFGQNMTSEQKEKINQLTKDSMEAYGNAGVCTVSIDAEAKPAFAMDYIFAVNNEAAFQRVMEEGMELYKTLWSPMYEAMGMESAFDMRKNVKTHQGVSINEMKFNMNFTDANSPEAQMMKTMYGEDMTFEWAIFDKTYVAAMGNDRIGELIDRVKAGMPASLSTELQNAVQLAPAGKNADLLMTVNVIRMFKMIKAFAPLPLPPMDFSSSSNIVMTASIGNGQLTGDLIIPKQHVMEVMQVVHALMAQQAQQQNNSGGMSGMN